MNAMSMSDNHSYNELHHGAIGLCYCAPSRLPLESKALDLMLEVEGAMPFHRFTSRVVLCCTRLVTVWYNACLSYGTKCVHDINVVYCSNYTYHYVLGARMFPSVVLLGSLPWPLLLLVLQTSFPILQCLLSSPPKRPLLLHTKQCRNCLSSLPTLLTDGCYFVWEGRITWRDGCPCRYVGVVVLSNTKLDHRLVKASHVCSVDDHIFHRAIFRLKPRSGRVQPFANPDSI